MNYIDQVKRVKDQIDALRDEIHDGAGENPGDEAFCRDMGRLLGILHVLSGDVSRAIDAIEEANLQHLP